ncbi:MAG: glycosyltransferase family 4 protein, partial [Muriicola sp.]|nr:glycosyltransferase family 4 protein [Muriicola sp.]
EHAPMIEPLICYFPFLFDSITERHQKSWLSFNERAHFIFIGNGKHRPNTDAILWLKQNIWPLIRKEIPKAKLSIYGPYFSPQIKQLHDPETGFLIMNWAPDAAVVMGDARVNLIPLRIGAGIKGKQFLGLTCGTPSVTTEIGAEGIIENKDFMDIASNEEDFAKKAVALYTDEILWETTQHAGIELLNTRFLKGHLDKNLKHRIKDLQRTLETHRTNNILGGMLLHHTLASTKYLSKWIELKNTVNPKNK